MLSLFKFIDFGYKAPEDNYGEISSIIEKGEITPCILAKYCMPKRSFYDINFFSGDDIIKLYNELKLKKPFELNSLIIQIVLPDFKYWGLMCVTQFESIIKEKNTNIDYNHIYLKFYNLLQTSNIHFTPFNI